MNASRPSAAAGGPHTAALASAARAVAAVVCEGRSADAALLPFEGAAERAAVRALTLGSLRWYLRLLPAVQGLLRRQAARMPPPLRALLVVGAHQIEYARTPPQLTVHAAVNAARVLGHTHAAGLVNAVLRRFAAERAGLFARLDSDPAVASAHPAWLVQAIRAAWPLQWQSILAANNLHPPLTLRVDLSRTSVAAFLEELAAAGLAGRALPWAAGAVQLDAPVPVGLIPGFRAGRVSVQDGAAQLAAPLLDAHPGMRVLDACAAPGGKTLHLLERTPGLSCLAVDVDGARLARVRENLARAGRDAGLLCADMTTGLAPDGSVPAQLNAGMFDRILLDAPCSATGVIRRHPDIKLLRRESDLASLAAAQLRILATAFRLLAPGGRLLYCTCSLLPVENEQVIGRFVAAHGATAVPVAPAAAPLAPAAIACAQGVQLLPGSAAGTDGFYYACIEKHGCG